jgi:hypothetical protein
VEVRHERRVLISHALSDDLAHEVGEVLRDAARRRSPEAEHELQGNVDVVVPRNARQKLLHLNVWRENWLKKALK